MLLSCATTLCRNLEYVYVPIEAFSGRLKTIKCVSRIYPSIKTPPHFPHLICLAFVFESNRVLHKENVLDFANANRKRFKFDDEYDQKWKRNENRTHTHTCQMYIIYIVCVYMQRERERVRKSKRKISCKRQFVRMYIVHSHRATANNSDAKVCIKYATTNRDGRLHFVYSMNWNGKKSC